MLQFGEHGVGLSGLAASLGDLHTCALNLHLNLQRLKGNGSAIALPEIVNPAVPLSPSFNWVFQYKTVQVSKAVAE